MLHQSFSFDLFHHFIIINLGSDHGVKAQGDGWLLTVALLEGNNLATVVSNGFSDVYVVFSCNGRTKTSSIKFQKSDPLWNGMFQFPVSVFCNGQCLCYSGVLL